MRAKVILAGTLALLSCGAVVWWLGSDRPARDVDDSEEGTPSVSHPGVQGTATRVEEHGKVAEQNAGSTSDGAIENVLLLRLLSLPPPTDKASVRRWLESLKEVLGGGESAEALVAALQALDGFSFNSESEYEVLSRSRSLITSFMRRHPEHLPFALDQFLWGPSTSAFCLSTSLRLAVNHDELDSIAAEWAQRYSSEQEPAVQDFLAVNSFGIGDPRVTESIIRAELDRQDQEGVGLSRAIRAMEITLIGEALLREQWQLGATRVLEDYSAYESIPNSTQLLQGLLVERASRPGATVDEIRAIRAFLSKMPEAAEAESILDGLIPGQD